MLALKKILVPTDFSAASNLALRYGYEMAQTFGAALTVVHIADDPMLFAETTSDEYRATTMERSDQSLKESVETVLGTRDGVELISRCGSAASEIVDMAKADHFNMVIMGSHGRSAIASMLLGNTAEHVVRHSPCPVMAVRSPEHEF